MTPEAENELVAKWMGWARGGWDGDHPEFSQWSRTLSGAKNYYVGLPPYRTDPALLWELMERLLKSEWRFEPSRSGFWSAFVNTDELGAGHYSNTLAEAVFAAAVMQAQEETSK